MPQIYATHYIEVYSCVHGGTTSWMLREVHLSSIHPVALSGSGASAEASWSEKGDVRPALATAAGSSHISGTNTAPGASKLDPHV